MTNPSLLLEDKERLMSGRWLNCRLIEAAQSLLAETFPSLEGLQSPLNGERCHFKQAQGTFIQILHVERCHWVCASNVGCEVGAVNVFDSAYNRISLNTKQQICSLWQPTADHAEFHHVNMHQAI